MKSLTRRNISGLAIVPLILAAITLFLPATARADAGCKTTECTYIEGQNEIPGHCGVWDTSFCGCYENAPGHGGQYQTACNNPSGGDV